MRPKSSAVHFLLGLIVLVGLAVFSLPALATTYYVRSDGGTAKQCNGKADAPVSAAPNCAWASPTVALPMGDGQYGYKVPAALIKGGDTLIIASGSYMIGYSSTPIAGTQGQACSKGNPYECTITNIPSGIDADHPTVITGASCSAKPELWGTQRINSFFSLSGQHDVKIACLELTDHSNCIESYQPTGAVAQGVVACRRDSYPYGDWASVGISVAHVKNLTLQGLDIHGLANMGIHAGALSGNTLLDDVTIRGNGWVGFNGDIGSASSNSGTITIQNSSIEWNGCTEAYPDTKIVGCWAQQEGGYGDGLGTASTGGNWRVINTQFIGNTSDGLDLLYADGTGSVYLDRVTSKWNAGNQVKVSGNTTIQNSVVVGNCGYLKGWGAMSDGDLCRASGAALSISFTATNQTINLLYSTVTGSGDCLINGGTHGGFSSPNKSDTYNYQNNIFLGASYWRAGRNSCLDWYTDAATNPYTVNYLNNIVWNVKANACPAGSICKDPALTDESQDSFNANPLVSSPAVGNASSKGTAVPLDYYNRPRPSQGATIGAIQYRGQFYVGEGSGDSPLPPKGSTSSSSAPPTRSGDAAVPTQKFDVQAPVQLSGQQGIGGERAERYNRLRMVVTGRAPMWQQIQARRIAEAVSPVATPNTNAATGQSAQADQAVKSVRRSQPRQLVAVASNPKVLPATSTRQPMMVYLWGMYDWFANAYRTIFAR